MNIIVFITTKDLSEAERLSQKLLEEKLIACANILEGVKSFFWWEGKIDSSGEVLLILKSKENLFKKILKTVVSSHSYEVPEVIALPIIEGNPDYLKWIDESLVHYR